MAAPNLVALATSTVDTLEFEATSAAATVTGSTVAANHARVLGSIYATNIHATSLGTISVWARKGGVDYPIVLAQRVPLRTVVNVLLGTQFYLAEGDSIKVQANANSNVHVSIPYSDIV